MFSLILGKNKIQIANTFFFSDALIAKIFSTRAQRPTTLINLNENTKFMVTLYNHN